MIKNFFLITFRNLMKNKLFIFINIFGMAISIGCCLVAYFNWEFDATFDHHHTKAHQIYRVSSVRQFDGTSTVFGHAPLPLGPAIRQNIADVNAVTRMAWSFSDFKIEDNVFRANLVYVDPDFFNMFTFDILHGKAGDIEDKSKVLISDEMAMMLFNSTDVVGRQFTQVLGAETKEVTVGAVFRKPPMNNSFDRSAYMHFDNAYDDDKNLKEGDWKNRVSLYVEVDDPSRLSAVSAQLQNYRENNNLVREDFIIKEYALEPFIEMAHLDRERDTWSMTRGATDSAAVVSPIIMAALVLLISCFNMTNTSIAISARRLKEIGIRKVMGSMRVQLIIQFIGETLFICFLALTLGLFIGEVLVASWNALWPEIKIATHYTDAPQVLIFLGGVLLVTGLVAGSYPAFYISNFEPVSILKGKLKFGGTNYFTRTLLILQYAFSLIAVVFSIAFYQNSLYQRDFYLGFDDKSIIIAYVNSESEYETYKNAIAQDKDIEAIAGSKHSIFSARYNDPVKYQSQEVEVDIIDVGDEYVQTMGLQVVAGRDFKKDSETDRRESVIVTESLAKRFGWDNAIGKEITLLDTTRLFVVGVVKDVYTNGLWDKLEPMMIRNIGKENYTHVVVRAPVNKLSEVNAKMEAAWKEIFPQRLYNGRYLNEIMMEAVTVNNNIVQIFAFLGIVALLLSATGLYTLVSLNIIKRMKEIGVRKVLGASIANITRIINTEFVVMLLISSLFGCVMSFFAVDLLMSNIWDYYLPASYVTLVVGVGILFTVSAAVVGYKIFNAASTNPVNTLRVE